VPGRPGSCRILVVEDDVPVAASLRRTLEYAGFEVMLAHEGPTALAVAGRFAPDLVVLDVMLPGIDGYGVCRALRADSGDALVLMLTARDATADRVTGLDAGADDYLVKPFAYEELLARVRALLRRRPHRQREATLTVDTLTMDLKAHEVRRGDREIVFTALEFELLQYFMRHPRQVLTRQQLLDAVWAGGSAATSNVVDVYVGYLRGKLEAAGEPRLLHTVRGVGYLLRAR
jgi:two-component system response regulator MprA